MLEGNPLFVEQFAAWAAERTFTVANLVRALYHQIIAARIEHLSKVRIAGIRQRLRWGTVLGASNAIERELRQLETEVGRSLTG